MQGFQDTIITWKGEDFTIPAKGILTLIANLEGILSGASGEQAINVLLRPGGPSHTTLSFAFGAVLRHAGCDVSDEEIYLSIQRDLADASHDTMATVTGAIIALLSVMSPPLAQNVVGDDTGKKTKAASD